jgi:hypothetical protein
LTDDLEALLAMAGDYAEFVLVDQHDKELMPTFHMITIEGESMLAPTPWRDEDDKRMMLAALRSIMKDRKVVRYSMVSEAWSARQPKDWKPGQDVGPAPGERPDRKEVVIAVAADKARTVSRSWDIVRGESGSIVKLVLDKEHTGVQEGRMGNLLK